MGFRVLVKQEFSEELNIKNLLEMVHELIYLLADTWDMTHWIRWLKNCINLTHRQNEKDSFDTLDIEEQKLWKAQIMKIAEAFILKCMQSW